MTVAGSLERLCSASDALADVFCAVRVTACEDQPLDGATLAVDEFAEAMVELSGAAQALQDRVRSVLLAPKAPSRADAVRLVSLAQSVSNEIADGLAARVASVERRAELERAVRRGGAQWRAWWAATAHGLTECEPALREVRDALCACWRELAEAYDCSSSDDAISPAAGVSAPVVRETKLSGRVAVRGSGEQSGGAHR